MHHLTQQVTARSTREVVGHTPVRQIVRRSCSRFHTERRNPRRPAVDQQVAVAHSRKKLPGAISQHLLGRLQQFACFGRRNVSGGEVPHDLPFHRHQIAANGPIVRPQLNALCGRLQRGAATEIRVRVVAQQAHRSHIRSRWQMSGDVVGSSDHPHRRDRVHRRHASCLQGSPASE